MGSAEAKDIMEITGRDIEDYMKMKLYTEITLIKEKLMLFERKYECSFSQFEKTVTSAPEEDFEKWDDYMEWKAFHNKYIHLKEKIA